MTMRRSMGSKRMMRRRMTMMKRRMMRMRKRMRMRMGRIVGHIT
jgi:hypothetical protein